MESRAVARYVRITPRKARQVMNTIRGKNLAESIHMLTFAPKAAADVILKVVNSAAANAENNHQMNRDALYVAQAFVDQGPTLKRFMPRAQGRAAAIHKRTSHITVVLKER